jgi:hypothetical protein
VLHDPQNTDAMLLPLSGGAAASDAPQMANHLKSKPKMVSPVANVERFYFAFLLTGTSKHQNENNE